MGDPQVNEPKKLFCPQCKEWYPETHFECQPLDLRCNRCVPTEVAMRLYDKRKEQAGHVMAQILDSSDKAKSLKPLERMLNQAYDLWGGSGAFLEDGVQWIKDLGCSPRTKAQAVSAWMKILSLHAKVDRMRLEDDWKQMDDEQVRASLKLKMMALMAEVTTEEAKKKMMKHLSGND